MVKASAFAGLITLVVIGVAIYAFFTFFNGKERLTSLSSSIGGFVGSLLPSASAQIPGSETNVTQISTAPAQSGEVTNSTISSPTVPQEINIFVQQPDPVIIQQDTNLQPIPPQTAVTQQVVQQAPVIEQEVQQQAAQIATTENLQTSTSSFDFFRDVEVANISGIGRVTLAEAQKFLSDQGFSSLLESVTNTFDTSSTSLAEAEQSREDLSIIAQKEFQAAIATAVGVQQFGEGFATGFANPCFGASFEDIQSGKC